MDCCSAYIYYHLILSYLEVSALGLYFEILACLSGFDMIAPGLFLLVSLGDDNLSLDICLLMNGGFVSRDYREIQEMAFLGLL